LKAEATAKQVAEKAVRQAVSGVMTARKAGQEQLKTCSHMKLDDKGNAITTETQCLDLDKGSNLVKCFFEISGSQTFMVDYQCFYPALWKTWFLSFKKVYLAMKAKGYVVNTHELQQRRCFYDEDLFYHSIQTKTDSPAYKGWFTKLNKKTAAERQANCLVTFTQFCSNTPSPFDKPTEIKSVALAWIVDNGHPNYDLGATWPRGTSSRANTLCDTNLFDNDGYHIDWHGNHCGSMSITLSGDHREEKDVLLSTQPLNVSYVDCNTDWPLWEIRRRLEAGAKEFPKAQFEKKSPVERIWFGFEYHCKRPFQVEHNGSQLFPKCLETFDKKGGKKACSIESQKQMMLCFREELLETDNECKVHFDELAIGVDGSKLDSDDGKIQDAFQLLYSNLTSECGFLKAGSKVNALAAGRCKPERFYAQCKVKNFETKKKLG
jgi:hypothetical protein